MDQLGQFGGLVTLLPPPKPSEYTTIFANRSYAECLMVSKGFLILHSPRYTMSLHAAKIDNYILS